MRPRSIVLAVLGAAAITSAASAQPPRATAREQQDSDERAGGPLLTAGAFTFLGSYGLSIGLAANSLDEDNRWLYLPLAGPWLTLADDRDEDASTRWLLALDGVTQAAGVVMVATAYVQAQRRRHGDSRLARITLTPRSIGYVTRF